MSEEAVSRNTGRSMSSVGASDASSIHASMMNKFEALKEEALNESESSILAVLERLVLLVGQDAIPQRRPDMSAPLPTQQEAPTAQVSNISHGPDSIADISDIVRASADNIDRLYAVSLGDAESFLMSMWEIFLCVARIIPYDDPGQDRIVSVLETLRLRAKTTINLWGLTRGSIDPMQDSGNDTVNIEDASAWVSLNAFAARITNKGLVDCSLYAVIEIQKALEQEIPPSGPSRDLKLRTANNWILISGVKLFKNALKGDTLDEGELAATAAGPLYMENRGQPGLCMDRWRFWLRRFQELGSDDINDRIGYEATKVARRMEEIMEGNGQTE
ncbi:hypothetical protein FNAPI_942 [Fusarium napiforme]|uniref:Uncharacterized protein n=1 Tax=Fusarium napiforme TaxID=42672 RepID=A0A8H5NHS1_9HYPO|nr:hypothetical protein FNAPI_942 [Fusarium napiforme]